LSEIQKQNNGIENIEFHLYCTDYDFPYIIGLFDGAFKIIKSKTELDPIWTDYIDQTDECENCNSDEECDDDHIAVHFSKEKYIKYMGGLDKKHQKRLQNFDEFIEIKIANANCL
jgi:hypothetical protein